MIIRLIKATWQAIVDFNEHERRLNALASTLSSFGLPPEDADRVRRILEKPRSSYSMYGVELHRHES